MKPRTLQGPLLRALCCLGVALAAAPLAPSAARAQSIGFEAGLASVENYDAFTPALGASLFLPFTERLRGVASYSQWTGCDAGECDDPRTGYGNRGFNVLGMYRAFGNEYTGLSLGAGLGWYEMLRLRDGESDAYYEQATTFAAEIRRAVAYNSAMYLRAETSIPNDDSTPRWGGVRLGVDVRPF